MPEEKNNINTIYDHLYNQLEDKESFWCTLTLRHSSLFTNMIVSLFKNENYITQENAVFYMGMLYNLLIIL